MPLLSLRAHWSFDIGANMGNRVGPLVKIGAEVVEIWKANWT